MINLEKEKLKRLYYFKRNNYYINKNYKKWIQKNEPNGDELEKQREEKFANSPLISVVIPMYNTDVEYFKILIDSLTAQTYSNIEICIADGSPYENPQILDIINNDNRIIYKHLEENGGISFNTNEAIKMAKGEYIAFVDHDDVLPLFAFYEVVNAINQNPNVEFIYSDEDIIIGNKRCNPSFKPDFSIDTLRSYNYISHLSVVKKELLNRIGGLDSEFDGAQDYELIFRIIENTSNIVHISKILYHWRFHRNSTSANSNSTTYAFESGRRAIQKHLERLNIPATVTSEKEVGRYRVKYNIISEDKVSILIPNKDNVEDLKKCINSILKSTYSNYEIIVIENNSTSKEIFDYYDEINKIENIKVVKLEINEFNYSKINNYGVKFAEGKYLLFLNNDTEVIESGWIEEMLGLAQREDVGIVGAKLLYPDNTVQHAGVIIGMGGVAGHINKDISCDDPGYFSRASVINNYSAVTAACLMTKKEIFEKINGFDENLKVAFNDVDLCLKIRSLGYLCVFTPYAKLYHFESKTRGYEDTKEKKARFAGEIELFKKKWKDVLDSGDPCFNKNLSLNSAKFIIDKKGRINH